MKRFFLFLVLVVFTAAALLTGCSSSSQEINRKEELTAMMESTYDELTATFSGATGQYNLVAEYLKSWANKNKVSIAENGEHYMVIINPATEDCKDEKSTVIQCAVETTNFKNSLQSLAISLTCLLGPESHGKITLIVTETNNGEYLGAKAADPAYYQCDNFINMQHSDSIQLFTFGSYAASATMTSDIAVTSPSYSHAYAITLSTAGYHDLFDFDGTRYPNPVEVIGSLLASAKSSGVLFQLASFECETTEGYIPTSATAIVVVDGNNVENFNKKFRSSYRNMKERFEKLQDNFVYTFTETAMPAAVMTNETSDNIISLMYTLKTGIYLQDEDSGDIISASGISHITTLDHGFRLSMDYRSTDQNVLSEMSEVFLTTSGLCDIQYESSDPYTTWPSADNKNLAEFFADALGAKESLFDTTLQSGECDIFAEKAPLSMISYRCNIHHGEAALANILRFLDVTDQE